MFNRHIITSYSVYLIALILAGGCDSRLPDSSVEVNNTSMEEVKPAPIADKVDLTDTRIHQILTKLNATCQGSYSLVYHASGAGETVLTADYALCESLSDDGIAALLGVAITQKQQPPLTQGPSQVNPSVQRQQLEQLDYEAGKLVAMADYQIEGFQEYLQKSSLYSAQPGMTNRDARIRAFSRGYHEIQPGK